MAPAPIVVAAIWETDVAEPKWAIASGVAHPVVAPQAVVAEPRAAADPEARPAADPGAAADPAEAVPVPTELETAVLLLARRHGRSCWAPTGDR